MGKTAWIASLALTMAAGTAWAQHDMNATGHAMNAGAQSGHMMEHSGMGASQDPRELVHYPEPLQVHTFTSMRDHVSTLQHIQDALGRGAYDEAANLAETRLGMSSLEQHNAHEVAQYMPARMAEIGTNMHRSASQFAVVARDASVSGDLKPVLSALAHVTAQCVACHAAYRLR